MDHLIGHSSPSREYFLVAHTTKLCKHITDIYLPTRGAEKVTLVIRNP